MLRPRHGAAAMPQCHGQNRGDDTVAQPTSRALLDLNARSREIFRRIVESYLATGEPVGSRNLSRILPIALSPASIRNVMSDLEMAGLLFAPHTSAGRLPTEAEKHRHDPGRGVVAAVGALARRRRGGHQQGRGAPQAY
jgi:hypothetical protein